MKHKKYGFFAFAIIFILIFNSAGITADAEPQVYAGIPEGFRKVAENETLVLATDQKSGEFAVVDKLTGHRWWSNPPDRNEDAIAKGMQMTDLSSQLLMKVVNLPDRSVSYVNSLTGSVNKDQAAFSEIKSGFRIVYGFPSLGMEIPMEIVLGDRYIEASVPVNEIAENGTDIVYSISVLPFFGAGSQKMNGYMLVPDGSGALINYNNEKHTLGEYKQSIYGKDFAYNRLFQGNAEQDARLPVFGSQNGTTGFLAVITEGDAHSTINARVSGAKSSYNTVFAEFTLRTSDMYDIGNDKQLEYFDSIIADVDKISIRYYLLNREGCDYNAMASKYRQYLEDEKGLEERSPKQDIPLFIELYGAIRKRVSKLGFMVDSVHPLSTYGSALEILKTIKSRGVEDIVLKYTNINRDNIRGTYLSKFRPEPKLGSSAELDRLADYCRGNNILFTPNADLLYFKKSTPGNLIFFNAVKTLPGPAAMQYVYQLSTNRAASDKDPGYLLNPAELPAKATGFIKSFDKLGFNGISLDTLGNTLYSDFSKRNRLSRQRAVKAFQQAMELISEKTESILMSDANAYMFPYARYIEDSPQTSSDFDLIDEQIPFYQMVLSGFSYYSTEAVNFDSNTKSAVLRAIENGSSLKYTWITGDPSDIINTDYMHLYGADSSVWLEHAVSGYHMVNEIYRKTGGSGIVHHSILADGVRETTYANGTRVIVNYNSNPVTVYGKYRIEPESCIVH